MPGTRSSPGQPTTGCQITAFTKSAGIALADAMLIINFKQLTLDNDLAGSSFEVGATIDMKTRGAEASEFPDYHFFDHRTLHSVRPP